MKIEDLPPYIKKHASSFGNGIKIDLYWTEYMSEEELKELPKTKKWIKAHGGGYDSRGYWYIPGKGDYPPSAFKRIFIGERLAYVLK